MFYNSGVSARNGRVPVCTWTKKFSRLEMHSKCFYFIFMIRQLCPTSTPNRTQKNIENSRALFAWLVFEFHMFEQNHFLSVLLYLTRYSEVILQVFRLQS